MPSSLQDARNRIDDVDRQLVELLAQRQELVDEIAETKAASGRDVKDPSREDELLTRVRDLARSADLSPDLVADLYGRILDHFVGRQRRQLDGDDSAFSSARAA